MKKIILIRHAESEGNLGQYFEDSHIIMLSNEGKKQSQELIEILEKPDRIFVSKFLRTQQTAEPLIRKLQLEKHPHEVHLWFDVHEFEPHDPKGTLGLNQEDRMNYYLAYWDKLDPNFKYLPGYESFFELMNRILGVLKKLKEIPNGINYVFTHGIVIKIILFVLNEYPNIESLKKESSSEFYFEIMKKFREFNIEFKTKNAGQYDVTELVEKYGK